MKRDKMLALLLAGCTALTCLSFSAQAGDMYHHYGQEGWWKITYTTLSDDRRLCVANVGYAGENLNLTFMSSENDGERRWSITWESKKWKLKKGAKINLTLVTPRNQRWNIEFEALSSISMFGWVNKDIMNSIAMDRDGQLMTWFHNGKTVMGPLRLDRSAAAIRSMVHCLNDDPNKKVASNTPRNNEKKSDGKVFSGTGFFIAPGFVLTNYHVIKECTGNPMIKYPDYKPEVSYPKGIDETNDLVILETKINHLGIASFRRVPKLGEGVASFGFPLSDILASQGNFTLGNITSTTGMGGDVNSFSSPHQFRMEIVVVP